MPPIATRLARHLLGLDPSLFRIATIPALAAIPLIVAFRVPREMIEVLLPPVLVTIVGLAALHSVGWKIEGARLPPMRNRYPSCIRSSQSSRCCSCFSWCCGRELRFTSCMWLGMTAFSSPRRQTAKKI